MLGVKNIFQLFVIIFWANLLFIAPLNAQVQLLLDMRSGEVLFEKNADIAWYPASLTKLMTLYLAFEAIKNNQISLNTPIIMTKEAIRARPSKSGLPLDSAITLKDALYLINVKSANDVAIALAQKLAGSTESFVKKMNQTAKRLGMSGTNFANPNGLHDKAQFTTARDMAILALSIRAHYPQYNYIFSTYELKLGDNIMKSYNNLLKKFRGANGMKTGFVCASGFNIVATAKRGNKSLMAVILGAASKRERGEMAAQLLQYGFEGRFTGSKKIITKIQNNPNSLPKNMRPLLCTEQANQYIAQRKQQFPYGLNDNKSFLKDDILTKTVKIIPLGKMREVPYPRPRPYFMPKKSANDNILSIPLPLARPKNR